MWQAPQSASYFLYFKAKETRRATAGILAPSVFPALWMKNLSKFQISRKQGKIFCHIPKKGDGTVGELVIRCPAPVSLHSLSEWDVGLNDSAR